MKEQKKKTNENWAWKGKPPKESDSKENNAFVKTFEGKKYYWCLNHNNGAGMWTLHHPNDCEVGKTTTSATKNANIAACDTMDSDSDQESRLHQSQVFTWFWLAITRNLLWWLLPEDVGLSLTAIFLMSGIIAYIILDFFAPREPLPCVPKKRCHHTSRLFTSVLNAMNRCATAIMKSIDNMKVRCQYRPPGHHYTGHHHRCKKGKPIINATLTGMTTTWANYRMASPRMFDSDSQALMLDDGTSACITNNKNDFIEPPQWVDHKVKGIKGHAKATHRGMIKWHLEDNNGLVHVMVITGAYLIPEASTRILSPQHLAQQADDHYPSEEGTGALTTSKSITRFWSQRHFSKTVPLDPKTNVGLTTTASGTRSFRAFCTTVTVPETRQTNIFMTHIIPDEEDDESFQPKDPIEPNAQEEGDQEKALPQSNEVMTTEPKTTLIDLGPVTHVIPEDQEVTSLDPHDELLRRHYRLGHLPFDCIRQHALKGQLPKRLLACKKPFCSACQYGKMTKRPW